MFEATVRPDGLDEYRALAKEITAENEASEPGQEIFGWFLDDHDVPIYERYPDAEATDDVKAATAGFNPRFYGPIAGHARG